MKNGKKQSQNSDNCVMRITKKQEAAFDGWVCQRLSADPGNRKLVKSFQNDRNPRLAAYLSYRGWEEDVSGATTFYVIKDQQNRILLFFSLKCGALFDPLNVTELREQVERYKKILEKIHRKNKGTAAAEELAEVEQLQMDYGMNIWMLEWYLNEMIEKNLQKISEVEEDRETDPNKKISQVVKTYPAVELVHFCMNKGSREYWAALKKRYHFHEKHTMGQVLFWHFVAPIIANIRQTLGCQYVYLFAADDSLNRRLVNYYQVALNFTQEGDISTSKPRYDFNCEFMFQKIDSLREFRDYYFEHFNADPEDIYDV